VGDTIVPHPGYPPPNLPFIGVIISRRRLDLVSCGIHLRLPLHKAETAQAGRGSAPEEPFAHLIQQTEAFFFEQ
jgi:hypothetical protein